MMEPLWRDLRYAVRQLARSPGFTAIAVLTLALGIGANTAIFSVVNAVLLRPLPYREPERLVRINETRPDGTTNAVSYPNFLDWSRQGGEVGSLALFRTLTFTVSGDGEPARHAGALVTSGFFRVLGVEPEAGRYFAEGEDRPGADAVAVIGHGLWQRRFGGARDVVGTHPRGRWPAAHRHRDRAAGGSATRSRSICGCRSRRTFPTSWRTAACTPTS